jgi:hypothetical protein
MRDLVVRALVQLRHDLVAGEGQRQGNKMTR